MHRLGIAELERIGDVLQHADRTGAHIAALLIEAMRAVETRVAPQHEARGAGSTGVLLGEVEQAAAEAGAMRGWPCIDAADLPGAAVMRYGGDHADDLAVARSEERRVGK